MIGAEPGVEPRALIVDLAVLPIGEPADGNGGPIHVGQEPFKPLAVVSFYFPLEVSLEATVRPRSHLVRHLGGDLPFLDQVASFLPQECDQKVSRRNPDASC
jgi:hypothetical protein